MSEEKRKEKVERVATEFTELPEEMKDKVAWYILGMQEEREKWIKRTA